MSNEDVKSLLNQLVLAQKSEPVAVKHDMIDGLSKVGIALCTAGILWVGSQIQMQDRKLIEIEANQRHIKTQVDTFNEFTKIPRFTRDDFFNEMRLFNRRVEMIEQELRYRSEFMSETNRRLKDIQE